MGITITALQVERFKRVQAVTVEPTADGLTVIGGKNKSGKTSVIDGIAYALGGARFKPTEAKKRGSAKPAAIKVTLSDGMVVERKGKNGSLRVTTENGLKGDQSVLDAVIEKLALDLPKFMALNGKGKAEILLQIIGKSEELAALDADEKEAFETRKILKRDLDKAEKVLGGMVVHPTAPSELVDSAEILTEIEKIEVIRREHATLDAEAVRLSEVLELQTTRLAELEKRQGEIGRAIEKEEESFSKNQDEMTSLIGEIELHVVPDVEPLKESLASAEEINELVRENSRHKAQKEEVKAVEKDHEKSEKDLEAIREKRQALLESADMPLEGLSIVDGELVYNEALWDCMSSSEQLRVATSIVKALNPECGFVLLDKLEQMDLETLAEFDEWAKGEGLQILGTRVSTGGECGVIIEDGTLKE